MSMPELPELEARVADLAREIVGAQVPDFPIVYRGTVTQDMLDQWLPIEAMQPHKSVEHEWRVLFADGTAAPVEQLLPDAPLELTVGAHQGEYTVYTPYTLAEALQAAELAGKRPAGLLYVCKIRRRYMGLPRDKMPPDEGVLLELHVKWWRVE